MINRYDISVAGNAPTGLPADIAFLLLGRRSEEQICAIRKFPFIGPWGCNGRNDLHFTEQIPLPDYLDTVYLSAIEKKFYSLETALDVNLIKTYRDKYMSLDGEQKLSFIVGFAPYGIVVLWLYYPKKQYIIGVYQGEEIEVDMEDFLPNNPNILLDKICDHYVKTEERVNSEVIKSMLNENFFQKLMHQFSYRYAIEFVSNDSKDYQDFINKYELKSITDSLIDGTFNKLNDGSLLHYHKGGVVQKNSIEWIHGKNQYSCCFFFNELQIQSIFERFYGAHPETKTDFIIRIDAENKKYELSLFRQGLKEPVRIPESAYQLIVFKNKFEDYRSDNYNQPRGAWIW